MSITKFFVRPVTIIEPALVASYGPGTEPDYTAGTETHVHGWLHQLAESEQQTATRDAKISTHVLRLPSGTAISSGARVQVDGQTFEVGGPPASVWRPDGEHHVKVSLRYADG